jgi:hydroxymethylpyrimidine pyrophosphatase-like HAD family hydrolase
MANWYVSAGVAGQVSVAVGNAGPHARKAASVSVATNDQDGVAQAIERYVLAPRNVPV